MRPRFPALAALAAGALLAGPGCSEAFSPPLPPPFPTLTASQVRPDYNTLAIEQAVFAAINARRAELGLPDLAWDESLAVVARLHSDDMAARFFFEHVNPEGLDPTGRGAAHGVECSTVVGNVRYSGIGENLVRIAAYEFATRITRGSESEMRYEWRSTERIAEYAVDLWMDSPGHRENIVNPVYTRHGLGVVIDAEENVYITDNFCA